MTSGFSGFFNKFFFSVGGKILMLACGVALFSATLVSGMYYRQVKQVTFSKGVVKLEDRAQILAPALTDLFEDAAKDVAFQSAAPAMRNFHENLYTGTDLQAATKMLEDLFSTMLISRPSYRQIRIIGIEDGGREIIRVERQGDSIRVVAEKDLQQKGKETYFQQALKLKPGQVYLSDITLNKERGKISLPPMPMIRAATALYRQGKPYGILVINANYDFTVDKMLSGLAIAENLYITDAQGHYLFHPDRSKIFGFEYGTPYKITSDVPGLQEFLAGSEIKKTVFYGEGENRSVIHVLKIFFDPLDKKRFLLLGLQTSNDKLLQDVQVIGVNSVFLTLLSLLMALIVAALLARFLTEPLRHTINEIRAYEKGKTRLDLPTGRRDEIGELAGAFQDLIENLDLSRKLEQESLARLQAVMDNTVDGLITIDDRGTIQSYNKACEKIFGYIPAEVMGKNVKMLMPERYSSQHDGYLQNYHRTGEAKVIGVGREVEAQHKDGTVFPIELSVAQVNIKGRRIYSGIVRDITERKKAEEEVMRSNLELERFAYVASHDLQEPLRMVANFTHLLEEEYKDRFDDQGKQYMGFIIDAARRMQGMINDLLEYSRIGHDDAGFVESDCNALAKTAIDNLNESIRETRAKISVGELPTLLINGTRFTGLLQNLIGNAIKYRDKSRDPEIKISAIPRDGEWLFAVADNGIGIKQEYLKQIFIIFKRLHGKGEYQGTGIGLAICKKVIESFGGKIWAESEPGKGTTIYFTIPKRIKMKAAA